MKVAVVGASGFIGSHVCSQLERAGHVVVRISAPRLETRARDLPALRADAANASLGIEAELHGCDVLVNAAGLSDATSSLADRMFGANALLPLLLSDAATAAGINRFVHISSAAVQGDSAFLDESTRYEAHSPYAKSKVLAEQAVHGSPGAVIYRPTSVHGPSRPVTMKVASIARSPFAMVAAPGDNPTPQVHVANVAAAVELLAVSGDPVPSIVMHPWEGFTTATFLAMLRNGRPVRMIPRPLANVVLWVAVTLGRLIGGGLWAQARRLEILLRGQEQGDSWLASRAPDLLRPHPDWRQISGPGVGPAR